MNIENRAILQGPIPKPLGESLKIEDKVLSSFIGPEMSLDNVNIVIATAERVEEAQKQDFLTNNLLGRMAVERGIDAGYLFYPSEIGGMVTGEAGKDTIYLSAGFFKPLYFLNKDDAKHRAVVSDGCLLAMFAITDMLSSRLPAEVPFPTTPELNQHAVNSVTSFIRNKNIDNDPAIERFAQEFGDFMAANGSRINVTAQGMRLNINIDATKAFTILTTHDQAVRTVITRAAVDKYISELRKKHLWFSPSGDIGYGIPNNQEEMQQVLNLLGNDKNMKTMGDIYRAYKSSEVGLQMGEEIVKALLVSKHDPEIESSHDEQISEIEEWDEELEVNRPVTLPKGKKNKGQKAYRDRMGEE